MIPGFQFTHYAGAHAGDRIRVALSAHEGPDKSSTYLVLVEGCVGRLWRREGPLEWTPRNADGFIELLPIIFGQSLWIEKNGKEVFSRTEMLHVGMLGFLPDDSRYRQELTRRWLAERHEALEPRP